MDDLGKLASTFSSTSSLLFARCGSFITSCRVFFVVVGCTYDMAASLSDTSISDRLALEKRIIHPGEVNRVR